MKIRFLLALVGLAISFALPTFAQQKETVDPQIRQELLELGRKYADAFNNNDAAALAALYTEDAVEVTDTGPIYGREALEKHFADVFKQFHFSNHIDTWDKDSPHIIDTAGNETWDNGEWSQTILGKTGGPIQLKGYWSSIEVREGDARKIRMTIWNVTPAPAATPSPTTSPSNQ
jgi:ketosteroid isomerase-like protein